MASASDVRRAARQYLQQHVTGAGADIEFVGMAAQSNGTRVGYDVREPTGPSIVGAVFGALLFGLLGLLVTLLVGIMILIILPSPSLLMLVGIVLTGGGAVLGAQAGARRRPLEHVTVTVDATGQVTMVNTDLSSGEFSRALGRDYDVKASLYDEVITEASKHWLLHKLFDRYT